MDVLDGELLGSATRWPRSGRSTRSCCSTCSLGMVDPDWDQVLELYAPATSSFVIANPQWERGETTVRLIDLGRERYLEAVPPGEATPELFDRLDEWHRGPAAAVSRHANHVWQWGITDADLVAKMDELGFSLEQEWSLNPPAGHEGLRQQDLRVQPIRAAMSALRCLGVLLCYNDGDLLEESISYLLDQNHDLIAWDHGSTDETPSVLERFRRHCREIRRVPREFDFYELYPAMSRHLIENYVARLRLDLLARPGRVPRGSRPRSLLLRVPRRGARLRHRLDRVPQLQLLVDRRGRPRHSRDDPARAPLLAVARLPAAHPLLARRVTNIRRFNHNPLDGTPSPRLFNLRHYPMRSPDADAGPRPARPRRAAPRADELPLREHAPAPGLASDPRRGPSLRRRRQRARPGPDLRLARDLRHGPEVVPQLRPVPPQ